MCSSGCLCVRTYAGPIHPAILHDMLSSRSAPTSLLVLSLGVFAAGCGSSEPIAAEEEEEPPPVMREMPGEAEELEEPVEPEVIPSDAAVSMLLDAALAGADTLSYADMIDHLGPPTATERRGVANAFDPAQTDSVYTLTYPSMEALLYEVVADSRSFLVRLRLSDPTYSTPHGFTVGTTTRTEIETEWGDPERTENATWIYPALNEDQDVEVHMTWDNDTLASIAYVFLLW